MRLVIVMLLVAAAAARADGIYISESAGAVTVGDELRPYVPELTRATLAVGWRRRHWAAQLDFTGDLTASVTEPDLASVGVTVKYLAPVSPHLDAYLRGRAMRGAADNNLATFAGNGLGGGAGVQLKGHLTLMGRTVALALFVDAGYDFYRLHDQTGLRPVAIDATLSSLSFGWAIGQDF